MHRQSQLQLERQVITSEGDDIWINLQERGAILQNLKQQRNLQRPAKECEYTKGCRAAVQRRKKLLFCHSHHRVNKHEPSHIFLVDRNFFSINRKYEQATPLPPPTYTKLLMSDSSVLICCANFIGELHRLYKHLSEKGWGNSTALYAHMVMLSQSCHGCRHLDAALLITCKEECNFSA